MPVDMNLPILVVDDYREMLRLIGTQLHSLGFRNIDEVTGAPAAVAKELGVVAFIVKPFTISTLKNKMIVALRPF